MLWQKIVINRSKVAAQVETKAEARADAGGSKAAKENKAQETRVEVTVAAMPVARAGVNQPVILESRFDHSKRLFLSVVFSG